MLENERIIVQDRGGIDAGLAALMQNANKGSMDPAALMAMMNNGNGGFGGNGGWWWIFIIVLFWMWGGWGGNGFGRGNGQSETNSDFARLAAMGNVNNNSDLLMQAIQGNKDAINSLATAVNCDSKSINQAICAIQGSIDKVSGQVGYSAERVINAVNTGDASIAKAISDCCCTTQRSIDAVNLNLTKMDADNRLALCQQNNMLVNTMNQNTLSLRDANLANTQAIIQKIDSFENLYRQDKYEALLAKNTALTGEISQMKQNQYILSSVTAPITAQINALQNDVDGIKCKMPNTVPVVYPQIKAFNSDCYNAAAFGAAAGTYAAEGFSPFGAGYNSGCC